MATTQSTGVLIAPDGTSPVQGRDIVAWAHGTVGIDSACTPIRTLDQIPGLADMLARGWVVVASDYPGLGTRGPHAYLGGDATAATVLDWVVRRRRCPQPVRPQLRCVGAFAGWTRRVHRTAGAGLCAHGP